MIYIKWKIQKLVCNLFKESNSLLRTELWVNEMIENFILYYLLSIAILRIKLFKRIEQRF